MAAGGLAEEGREGQAQMGAFQVDVMGAGWSVVGEDEGNLKESWGTNDAQTLSELSEMSGEMEMEWGGPNRRSRVDSHLGEKEGGAEGGASPQRSQALGADPASCQPGRENTEQG